MLASIKMPIDLFIGKSSVQTNVYVFRVGEAHQKDDVVKFIDFSVDGYTRSNRRKASVNLRDSNHAKERYQEVVDLVRYGKEKLHFLTAKVSDKVGFGAKTLFAFCSLFVRRVV